MKWRWLDMKWYQVLAASAVLILGLSLLPAASGERKGFEVTHRRAALGLVSVTVVRIDPELYILRHVFPTTSQTLSTIPDMPDSKGALVCFNASFFDEKNRPLGLLVSNGIEVQKVRNVSWGIFYVSMARKPWIVRKQEYIDGHEPPEFALQSGPTLVRDRVVRTDLDGSIARRSAVGLDAAGQIYVMVFNGPVTLSEVARFGTEELGLLSVMNLDGGGSTQIHFAGEASNAVLGEPIASGVCVFER